MDLLKSLAIDLTSLNLLAEFSSPCNLIWTFLYRYLWLLLFCSRELFYRHFKKINFHFRLSACQRPSLQPPGLRAGERPRRQHRKIERAAHPGFDQNPQRRELAGVRQRRRRRRLWRRHRRGRASCGCDPGRRNRDGCF